MYSSQNLLHKLCTKEEERTNAQYPTWFKKEKSCCEHRVAGLEHLYKVKVWKKNGKEKVTKRRTKGQRLKDILHQQKLYD